MRLPRKFHFLVMTVILMVYSFSEQGVLALFKLRVHFAWNVTKDGLATRSIVMNKVKTLPSVANGKKKNTRFYGLVSTWLQSRRTNSFSS